MGPRELARCANCIGYAEARAKAPAEIGCMVVHVGRMDEIPRELLCTALLAMRPVYADHVFVVFARTGTRLADPRYMVRFYDELAAAPLEPAARANPPRAGRSAPVYLGNHTALLTTVDGLKLYVDTDDLSLAPHLLLDGSWENWVTAAVKTIVKPGMRVADIGANFGYYATLMARIVGAAGWTHCFEPNPPVFDLLFRGMEINGFRASSTCHRIALASAPGTCVLNVWRRHAGGASFEANAAGAASYHDEIRGIEVETARLDDVLADDPRLDFIKIDAEGAEPVILAGARRVLAANRELQIVMEFSPERYAGQARELLAWIRGEGFSIAIVNNEGRFEEVAADGDDRLLSSRLSDLYLRRG